jgi:hypothetical protein
MLMRTHSGSPVMRYLEPTRVLLLIKYTTHLIIMQEQNYKKYKNTLLHIYMTGNRYRYPLHKKDYYYNESKDWH